MKRLLFVLALTSCAHPMPRTTLDVENPRLLNAFFGLDDALPGSAFWLCAQAPGRDGMPITFSRRVTQEPAPAAFTVTTRSGVKKTPLCVTPRPANEASENHTLLLIGDLGSVDDPPAQVEVTGALALEAGGQAQGLSVEVTPLEAGPTLVLALGYAPGDLDSDCPKTTQQVVVVAWAGGVHLVGGATRETHRQMYRVATERGEVMPLALGDLDDQDNYVHLCLDTNAPAARVSASAGVLLDPRDDVNPETSVAVEAALH